MAEHEITGIIVNPIADSAPAATPQFEDAWSAALEHLGGEILTYNVLYNIFLRAPDALFITDNLRILATNISGSLYFAYHMSEILQGTLDMFVPEGLQRAFHEEWAEFMGAPRFRAMYGGKPMQWQKKTGEPIPVTVELTPLVELVGPRVIVRVRHRV